MAVPRPFPSIELLSVETRDSLLSGKKNKRLSKVAGAITPSEIEKKLGDRDYLVYNMRIKAATKRMARAKGRFFVRAKNPFEPSLIECMGAEELGGDWVKEYAVVTGVRK